MAVGVPAFTGAQIYFSTGTGNSYRVATWMGEEASLRGVEASVVQIEEAEPARQLRQPEGRVLLGIVCPTHGFTAPWHMIKFAWGLPRARATAVAAAFCCATRGGFKLGSFYGPGLSGTATYLLALILWLKGYRMRGVLCLNMPINWMTLVPGQHPDNTRAIVARARPLVASFMGRLLDGRTAWLSLNNAIELVLGLALVPISAAYLYVGRIGLAKLFFANNRCNACGNCVSQCPTNGVKMVGERKPRPYWTYHCESCMRCMAFCSRKAIESGQSWAVILFYICFLPLTAWGGAWLTARLAGIASDTLLWVIATIYAGPAMLLAYYLFYYLIKLRPINALFTYTTLTHWYRRYREPDVKLRDILPPSKRKKKAGA